MTEPWQCDHVETQLRFRRIQGGGIQYARQCPTCGRCIGSAIKHSDVPSMPPEWDYDLADRWDAQQRESSLRLRESARSEMQADYRAYLQTGEWRERRRRVLERERYVCQGCREGRATEVHHLNYAHVGSELLFDLVALCDACHRKAHGVTDA